MSRQTGSFPVLRGGPTFVYRIYGYEPVTEADDALLYVGVTNDLGRRAHGSDPAMKGWWYQADRIEWEVFPTRAAALKEESRLIRESGPIYNKHGQAPLEFYAVLRENKDYHEPGCNVGANEAKRRLMGGVR